MKICKIIQDLFPNYIEKLTSEETNEYIENHIKECEECKEKLKTMQKEIEIGEKQELKKETKYLKKYNKKLRIFQAIILIFVIIFIAITARKMIIIQSMQNKIIKYEAIDNFYIKSYYYQGDKINFYEDYNKGNNYKSKASSLWFTDDDTRLDVFEVYGNGKRENWYWLDNYNNKDKTIKEAKLNQESSSEKVKNIIGISNFETSNFWELLIMAITSDISSESCNGKECYRISYIVFSDFSKNPILWEQENYKQIYYLEKETGLPVRSINDRNLKINNGDKEEILDFEYDFGNVTDEDLEEPNINEYEIIE